MMIDWNHYENFSRDEFACSHTGKCEMHPALLHVLQSIRTETGKPMFISSGYRDVTHPVEAMKDKPGEHTMGMAADIICHGLQAINYLNLALKLGVTRIGVHQKGRASGRYIHLGIADKYTNEFASGIWTY